MNDNNSPRIHFRKFKMNMIKMNNHPDYTPSLGFTEFGNITGVQVVTKVPLGGFRGEVGESRTTWQPAWNNVESPRLHPLPPKGGLRPEQIMSVRYVCRLYKMYSLESQNMDIKIEVQGIYQSPPWGI
jgi:hypothetical protein